MQEVWLTEHLGKSNIIYSSILPGTVNSSLPQKAVYGEQLLRAQVLHERLCPWLLRATQGLVTRKQL